MYWVTRVGGGEYTCSERNLNSGAYCPVAEESEEPLRPLLLLSWFLLLLLVADSIRFRSLFPSK